MRTCLLLISAIACTVMHAQDTTRLKPVDVDYMLRGYFYASSFGPSYLNGYGGWGHSENEVEAFRTTPERTGLEILVDTSQVVPLDSVYEGHLVVLRNHGPDTAYFPAQDSRLYMWAQAMRAESFADIEYLPSSWCGNSYHTLFLAPGRQWTFVMPKYTGRRTARMRLALQYEDEFDAEERRTIYSHTFSGGVNKGQFTQKQGHSAHDIMDPYND